VAEQGAARLNECWFA